MKSQDGAFDKVVKDVQGIVHTASPVILTPIDAKGMFESQSETEKTEFASQVLNRCHHSRSQWGGRNSQECDEKRVNTPTTSHSSDSC